MTRIVCALDRKGNLSLVGATEAVEIILVTETARDRVLGVENIELKGMPEEELHATTCDHLSHEIQTGRLNLVRLNNALKLES